MTIRVRTWTRDDFAIVRHILWQTWKSTYGPFIPDHDMRAYLDATYDNAGMEKLFVDPTITCLMAETDNGTAGFVRTHFDGTEHRLYVSSIYILPEFQHHGIGIDLMRRAAAEARRAGLEDLWLGVMSQNKGAVAWYQAMGFVTESTEPFAMGGTTVEHFIGHLPVSSLLGPARPDTARR